MMHSTQNSWYSLSSYSRTYSTKYLKFVSFALALATTTTQVRLVQSQHVNGQNAEKFNREIMERVKERLNDFLNIPRLACERMDRFRVTDGFKHGMTSADHELIFHYLFAEITATSPPSVIPEDTTFQLYFGLEDGTVFHYMPYSITGNYREPGTDGYRVTAEGETSNDTNIPLKTPEITIDPNDPNYKHWISCVDEFDGSAENCLMKTGSKYIECVNNCELIPCPTSNSTSSRRRETESGVAEHGETNETKKYKSRLVEEERVDFWCPNYVIKEVLEGEVRGFIPMTQFCAGKTGQPEQRPGYVLENYTIASISPGKHDTLGSCLYGDGVTLVNRSVLGNYSFCGSNEGDESGGKTCNDTFTGGFKSHNYDPRYREWYIFTRQNQHPTWSKPRAYYTVNDIGITYGHPIYDYHSQISGSTTFLNTSNTSPSSITIEENDDVLVFKGVLAVDYKLEQINSFLADVYNNTDMRVLIVETSAPNYLIANSRYAVPVTKMMLKSNESEPCPLKSASEEKTTATTSKGDKPEYLNVSLCNTVRVSIHDFQNSSDESQIVLYRAFMAFTASNYSELKHFNFKYSDEIGASAFVAQGQRYMLPGVEKTSKTSINDNSDNGNDSRTWFIVVILPMERSMMDKATPGSGAFAVVMFLGTAGFVSCGAMLRVFFMKRNERAIINADWRFTCAFLLGCTVMNLSTFTLLGENSNPMCMLRMWSFNCTFACALSPLFVKVWRMAQLLHARNGFKRKSITNTQAFVYTLPLISLQIFILTLVSILDPPLQTELLGVKSGEVEIGYQEVTCQHRTNVFFIVQVLFDATLILIGSVLAYQSRDLDPKYGEAKQLGFSMYNLAFTGIVSVATANLYDLEYTNEVILQSVGVFWASFFCSFAFTLPKMREIKHNKRRRSTKISASTLLSSLQRSLSVNHQISTEFHKTGEESRNVKFRCDDSLEKLNGRSKKCNDSLLTSSLSSHFKNEDSREEH